MDGRDDALDSKLRPFYYTIASSDQVYQLKSIKAFFKKKIGNIRHPFFFTKNLKTQQRILLKTCRRLLSFVYHNNCENNIEMKLTSIDLADCSALDPTHWTSQLSLLGLLAKIKV